MTAAEPAREGAPEAIRAVVRGDVQGVGFRDGTVTRARELEVRGWARHGEAGTVLVHAEGDGRAVSELVAFLRVGPAAARVAGIEIEPVPIEGHEQFALRGVSAGVFVIEEHTTPGGQFELRLEIGGVMHSWRIPKGPSLDPAVKRFAIEAADHATAPDGREETRRASGAVIWDHGTYEQGGRVAWPEAVTRGHAVFVLHGEKVRGGFALQRTRPGTKVGWLLVKRRDEDARPGSDVVAECRTAAGKLPEGPPDH